MLPCGGSQPPCSSCLFSVVGPATLASLVRTMFACTRKQAVHHQVSSCHGLSRPFTPRAVRPTVSELGKTDHRRMFSSASPVPQVRNSPLTPCNVCQKRAVSARIAVGGHQEVDPRIPVTIITGGWGHAACQGFTGASALGYARIVAIHFLGSDGKCQVFLRDHYSQAGRRLESKPCCCPACSTPFAVACTSIC